MKHLLTRVRHGRAVGVVRYHLYRDLLVKFPRRHSCNICRWRGRRFLTYHDRFVLCPRCGSQVRHRLIAAAVNQCDGSRLHAALRGARVLHISPEYCLGLLLRPLARHYVRADRGMMASDLRQDITVMPFRDGVFDAVLACDTLEHVLNDRTALAECRRVLRPGGIAILTVPQNEDRYETYEDPSIATEAERFRHFGQQDHVRNYGLDFGDRVAAAGFEVTCLDADAFDPGAVVAHVLRPPFPAPSPVGWRNRRVYVASRSL